MRLFIWVCVFTIFIGASLSSFGDQLIAQRSPIVQPPIPAGTVDSEEDSSLCLDYETNTSSNNCEPEFNVEIEVETEPLASTSNDPETNETNEEVTIILNPEISFVEDYVSKLDSNKSRDTIFYGGVVPFVALPDGELSTEDSFFNEESFSIFFYLKRKF